MTNLPSLTPLIGRERELAELRELIASHRLVTLTGAGGTGKTQLAFHAAREALAAYPDGCWIVEFPPLIDPSRAALIAAHAVGIDPSSYRMAVDELTAPLKQRHLLLVLDGCEHVSDAVAEIVGTLLSGAPRMHILATSRKPLLAEGERILHIAGLQVPPAATSNAEQAIQHSAVELFVKRAHAADPRFTLDDRTASPVTTICRLLDGIPLAIELAAARVATMGVTAIAERLDDRFRRATGGRR